MNVEELLLNDNGCLHLLRCVCVCGGACAVCVLSVSFTLVCGVCVVVCVCVVWCFVFACKECGVSVQGVCLSVDAQ